MKHATMLMEMGLSMDAKQTVIFTLPFGLAQGTKIKGISVSVTNVGTANGH